MDFSPRLQRLDNRQVRFRKRILPKLGKFNPSKGGAMDGARPALMDAHPVGMQLDGKMTVRMMHGSQVGPRLGPDAEFLLQLANDALRQRFPLFARTAGKFP
ncbi:MAG: hypothetical protein A2X46_00790 [Lentisphaerae bacterium GWF2_57_35]|nr:MAG: hypothetical protein A2X46_00790 [Lentisphaerae bacterium GWF2_57_35]